MPTDTYTTYQKALQELKARQCPTCAGLGEVDDSDPGDMYLNRFKCPACQGTGFKQNVKVDIHYS